MENNMEMNLEEMEMANLEKVSGGYIVENFKPVYMRSSTIRQATYCVS